MTDTADFSKQMDELKKDKRFQAEGFLLELTEKIVEIHGQYMGRYKILYWILEWSANKLIWR